MKKAYFDTQYLIFPQSYSNTFLILMSNRNMGMLDILILPNNGIDDFYVSINGSTAKANFLLAEELNTAFNARIGSNIVDAKISGS